MEKILIVDDEKELSLLLKRILEKEGLSDISIAQNLAEGYAKFEAEKPDLVLLDIMLPDGEGYDLCKKIRETSIVPILFMSAKGEEIDKLLGLAIGGDDYITKPFSPKEVAYRVKAHLRRANFIAPQQKALQVGPFQFNDNETELRKAGEPLELTAKEIALMRVFMHNPNQIISKETLFERVWQETFLGADNTLMVHIRRLREKIEAQPSKPEYLITVKGLGYKFLIRDI